MNALLYYVPRKNVVMANDYGALGLSHLTGTTPQSRACATGPDKNSGVVFWPGIKPRTLQERIISKVRKTSDNAPKRIGYFPEAQTWKRCADGAWYCGWENDAKPGPDDIAKLSQVAGVAVELVDGKPWIIPSPSSIPMCLGLDDSGETVIRQADGYERYFDALTNLQEFLQGQKSFRWTELAEWISSGLAVNYHVSCWEVLALELLSSDIIQDCAAAMCDLERMIEIGNSLAEKKK